MGQFDGLAATQVNQPPLNHQRTAELLKALRQRTPREISVAVMSLGGCFSPEMRRALELLAAERRASLNQEASRPEEQYNNRKANALSGHRDGGTVALVKKQ